MSLTAWIFKDLLPETNGRSVTGNNCPLFSETRGQLKD